MILPLLRVAAVISVVQGFAYVPPRHAPHTFGRDQSLHILRSTRSSAEGLKKPRVSSPPLTVEAATVRPAVVKTVQGVASSIETAKTDDAASDEYKKGIAIISFITLLNASLAPVWHTVFAGGAGPPPLFLNAVVSVTALVGLLAFGPFLDGKVETTSALAEKSEQAWSAKSFRGGIELGFWKGLGEYMWGCDRRASIRWTMSDVGGPRPPVCSSL
jgi:hypothetical protein